MPPWLLLRATIRDRPLVPIDFVGGEGGETILLEKFGVFFDGIEEVSDAIARMASRR